MNSPYRRPYPTKDGFIALLPYSTKHWIEFFNLVGHPELTQWDLVSDPVKRSENIDQLYAKIMEFMPTKTTDEWCELLDSTDIPHTRVNRLDDLLTNEHLRAVNFFEEYEHPTEGTLRRVRSPYTIHGIEQGDDIPTPRLGEANMSLLKELGLDGEEIKQLAEKGVISSP
jgi:crotonobetainyl-CoA:carnitine CoA-transferase CaiB-like acyl-CoA transferase